MAKRVTLPQLKKYDVTQKVIQMLGLSLQDLNYCYYSQVIWNMKYYSIILILIETHLPLISYLLVDGGCLILLLIQVG